MNKTQNHNCILYCISIVIISMYGLVSCDEDSINEITDSDAGTGVDTETGADTESEADIQLSLAERAIEHMGYLSEEIGVRVGGSPQEFDAGDFIISVLEDLGYEVTAQKFDLRADGTKPSRNISALLVGQSELEIIVGAHYDSVLAGKGATDNASGIGLMLALAEQFRDSDVPLSIRFVAFGAEEIAMRGSSYYVSQMTTEEIDQTVGMINLDSVVGGDYIYAYGDLGDEGWMREQSFEIAAEYDISLKTNPGLNPAYPAGTTGSWSDHAPFENEGIYYLYYESTNWELGDLDGDIQTVDHGKIWHTEKDSLDFFGVEYPGRIESQMIDMSIILEELLRNLDPPQSMLTNRLFRSEKVNGGRYLKRDGTPYDEVFQQ